MGKTKVSSKNILTPGQNETLNAILSQSSQNTTFLSDYLKDVITGGPTSSRVQQAVSNYKENIIPQVLSSFGEGRSSSALNQALSSGAQSLAQGLDADTLSAVEMLQQLTQGNAALGLGTNPNLNTLSPGKGQIATNLLLGLLSGSSGSVAGSLLGGVGSLIPKAASGITSWFKGLFGR